FDGEEGERRNEGPLSATLGLVYKFKQNSWKKSETVTIGYDEAQLRSLVDRVNALASDNAALKTQLANAKTEVITDIKVENRVIAAPVLLTFPINKSTVSNEARVNLGFLAKVIKQTNANVVYTITGYADSGTGSPKTNERLSKERAEAIYNVLVKEFNVNPSQLRTIYKGGVDNMYYDDPRLSRAVITIAEGL
ncbi:MAG TPA: cell envelope biogenesis protein OmpA, partial [Sphingobacterium sp.]|nr:cell envelope biogenesis protein OmpA [Sphingobacterium sp.]